MALAGQACNEAQGGIQNTIQQETDKAKQKEQSEDIVAERGNTYAERRARREEQRPDEQQRTAASAHSQDMRVRDGMPLMEMVREAQA